jgi:hypothetical protein
MRAPASPLRRWLEPFASGLWVLFLIWTAFVAIIWTSGIGEVHVSENVRNPELRGALLWLVRALDPIWFTLAGTALYFDAAARNGISTARRWAGILLLSVFLIATAAVLTGFPLGPIHLTKRLGGKIGSVPFGFLLLWLTIIWSGRAFALRLLPRASHLQIAAATSVLALLTLINLEPIAWKMRAFWLWYPATLSPAAWPPLESFATWLIVAFGLAWIMRESPTAAEKPLPAAPSAAIFCLLNTTFLLTNLLRLIQS